MLRFVRWGLLVAALVMAGLVGIGVAPASATPTTPPAATFIQCTDKGPTTSVYALVGGAALRVQSWKNFGYDIAGGPSHPTPTPRSCKSLPVVDLPIAAGSYALCGTVLGTAPGPTTQDLGCSNVSVPGVRPGKVHRLRAKAKGHGRVRVTWHPPVQNGSPVNLYVVKIGVGSHHRKKQVAGARHAVVLKHLPGGQRVEVRVKANNLYGFGPSSKKSTAVRVR